jgi:hypothetical protein
MVTLRTADEVIDALGGTAAVALFLEVGSSTVCNWRSRGFPAWTHMPLLRECEKRGMAPDKALFAVRVPGRRAGARQPGFGPVAPLVVAPPATALDAWMAGHGVSDTQLAAAIHRNPQTISLIRRGKRFAGRNVAGEIEQATKGAVTQVQLMGLAPAGGERAA